LALTGLTPKEFKELLPAFEQTYARRYPTTKTRAGQKRKRKTGAGRKSELNLSQQKLLFALVYLKIYPLQVVLGELFGVSQSQANRWIHKLLPILQQSLKSLGVQLERNPRQFAQRERQHGEPLNLIIDGTDRLRQRPKNKEKQALHYSGRKKVHTDKNLIIANRQTKRIGFLSPTYAGKVQDKKIADTERITYPRQSTLHKDTGFQAYEPRGVKTYQPKKSRATVN
jgi:hypothetical protein